MREYLNRIGAEVLNFRRAMVKIHHGSYYVERALIRLLLDGTVTCSVKDLEPTEDEAREMATELAGVAFPKSILARNADGLRAKIGGGTDIYEFWNRRGTEADGLIMCQERRIKTNGTKAYVPWVMMDDGQWVSMEPDGDLPFWKPMIGKGPGCRIMIHEGAKAAAAAQAIAEGRDGFRGHPWAEELAAYEHWGMIGGALAPHRTDYAELTAMAPTEVVYVCDNDFAGSSALQKVSKSWGRSMKSVKFGGKFPESWDLADPMPEDLFVGDRWIGPTLRSRMGPATWATELTPQPKGQKGKPVTRVTKDFAAEWVHVVSPEVYMHREWPNLMYSVAEFDHLMAPFSHVLDTGRILKRDDASMVHRMKYDPSVAPGVYGDDVSGLYVNTYALPTIVAEEGDTKPWDDYMATLIPGEADRHETLKWIATLISRPDIRMLYGLLLISETQGVGKGTLGDRILTPLIGETNVSFPNEKEIVDSDYNYWIAHKRLAVVHEIYAGHSSKAYNDLKSTITDKFITVKKKYQPNFEMENWIHVLACSNSRRAIKMAMDDRRWLVPKVSEKKQSDGYWDRFNGWLTFGGGLGIIRGWADRFVAEHGPVNRGEPAPWSENKREIVEEGYSPGQAQASQDLGSFRARVEAGDLPANAFIFDTQLVESVKMNVYEGRSSEFLEKPSTLRTIAKSEGFYVGDLGSQVAKWPKRARVISLDRETADTSPAELAATGRDPISLSRIGAM